MKSLGAIFIIIGIIALVGSLGFMFILFSFGEAVGALNDPALIEQAGVGQAEVQAFSQQVQSAINLGWVYAVAALLASVVSIKAGADEWKKK